MAAMASHQTPRLSAILGVDRKAGVHETGAWFTERIVGPSLLSACEPRLDTTPPEFMPATGLRFRLQDNFLEVQHTDSR